MWILVSVSLEWRPSKLIINTLENGKTWLGKMVTVLGRSVILEGGLYIGLLRWQRSFHSAEPLCYMKVSGALGFRVGSLRKCAEGKTVGIWIMRTVRWVQEQLQGSEWWGFPGMSSPSDGQIGKRVGVREIQRMSLWLLLPILTLCPCSLSIYIFYVISWVWLK